MNDWRPVKLGDVADLCLGKMLDAKKNKGQPHPYLSNPDVRWFGVDTSRLKNMLFESSELDRFGLRAGDVLVCEGGEAGRAAVWDGRRPDVKFQKAIHRVRPGPNLFNRFLVHKLFADHQAGRLKEYYTGATIKHLTGQDLATYEMSLPPVDEQRRIAELLDRAEALRAKRRAALALLDTLGQSIFLDVFGDPATNQRDWPEHPLAAVVEKETIVTYGIVQAGDEHPGGVPYIRTGDIVDGEIVQKGLRHTDPAIARKFARSRVQPGDIVMSIRATVGTTAVVPAELNGANLTQGTARISPGPEVDGPYLLHFLRSLATQRWISRQIKGATFREITLTRLRELPVLAPPLTLQRQFGARVSAVEKIKADHRNSLAQLDALFASLQHRAFRGEL